MNRNVKVTVVQLLAFNAWAVEFQDVCISSTMRNIKLRIVQELAIPPGPSIDLGFLSSVGFNSAHDAATLGDIADEIAPVRHLR